MMILATTSNFCGSDATEIMNLTSTIVTLIKIGVPILLIIFGMLDLGKAVMAQKEDEIKKGQQMFIKRLIAAVIVFFVVFIVSFTLKIFASNDTNIWTCVDGFINGPSASETTNGN